MMWLNLESEEIWSNQILSQPKKQSGGSALRLNLNKENENTSAIQNSSSSYAN